MRLRCPPGRRSCAVLLIAAGIVAAPASSARTAIDVSPEFGFSPGAGPGTVTTFGRAVLDRYFGSARSVGATVVRLDASRADRALAFRVARAQVAGLHVELIISLHGRKAPATYARTCRTIAAIYRPRGVMRFEMGNEPNARTTYHANPAPRFWARQQLACARAIRSAAGDAHIVTGGLAPFGRYGWVARDGSEMNPLTFLRRAYAAGLRKTPIDAIGWHPYSFRTNGSASDMLSTDQPTNAWAQMAWTTPSVRSLMQANGDENLRIDATEWGAPTNTSAYTEGVSEGEQAKLIAQGIAAWKTYPWHGDLLVYSWLDRGTSSTSKEDHFGLLRQDFSPKPAAAAFQTAVGS
jgi:cellulase (glycosyl hydrolase family 5)